MFHDNGVRLQIVEERSHIYICGDTISSQKTVKCKSPEATICQPYFRKNKGVSRAGARLEMP